MIAIFATLNVGVRAQTMYNNGTYDGGSGFNFTGAALADDFKVSSLLTFDSIRFYAHDIPQGVSSNFEGLLSWYIYADNGAGKPGTTVLSGASSAVRVTDTGATLNGNPSFEIGQFDFSVGRQTLISGDYWLRITEGVVGSDETSMFWMTTTSRHGNTAVSGGVTEPSPNYARTNVDLAFELRSDVTAVVSPEPASLGLMALGLGAACCIASRKRYGLK